VSVGETLRRAPGRMQSKSGAAGLSIFSNSVLIALKIAAGAITGSIAIITEAVHSSIDLVASVIAFISVRKAEEPADADHPYGHERVENLAAVIEGMLIVIGAGIIVFEATRRLVDPPGEIDVLWVGIAVSAVSTLANVGVSTFLFRRARELQSPALEGDAAHLRTDAMTSAGLLVGLGFVEVTGVIAFDSITALLIAVAIVAAGIRILSRSSRVLVDEAPPPEELDRIEEAIASARTPEVVGYHKLRARHSGSHHHVDLHVQFESGTTLERAHAIAHKLRHAIEDALPDSDVLIHVEPEGSVTPDEEDQPLRHGRL
jgi:cation diffusion facilitator family transporter